MFGICSLGLTELAFGVINTVEDQAKNKEIDSKIAKIAECIEEIKKGGGLLSAQISDED